MSSVAIHLVTHNGLRYVSDLFSSLAQQSYRNIHIRILDNASTDGTRQWLQTYTHRFFPHALLICADNNSYFVGGHNQLYEYATETYVQLINQDVILDRNYIARLVAHMNTHPKTASASGLIMRYDGQNKRYTHIDSAGIHMARNRKYSEIKAGEIIDKQQLAHWPTSINVFGVSGTVPMYRVAACGKQLFDTRFEMYKEDVDRARSLHKEGWQAYVVPPAHAYHDRTIAQHTKRNTRSKKARYCSYRNHMYTLLKHESRESFIEDFFYIVPHEIAKAVYLLFQEPSVLYAWKDIFKNMRLMRPKREKKQYVTLTVEHKHLKPLYS